MVIDNPSGNGEAGGGGSRRAPPTIDLDPSDVSGDTAQTAQSNAGWVGRLQGFWRAIAAVPAYWLTALLSMAGGAAAAALVIAMLAGAGWLGSFRTAEPDLNQAGELDRLTERMTRLESEVSSPKPDPSAARLNAAEIALAELRNSLAALQKSTDAVAATLTNLQSRPSTASVDLGPLTRRLDRLERTLQSARPGSDASDTLLRRAFAALSLDRMVQGGSPYANALTFAKSVAADKSALALLDEFANSGLPDEAELARALLDVLPKSAPMVEDEKPVRSTANLMDRLTAGAARLVRIERVEGSKTSESSRPEVLSAVKASARKGDLASVRRALDQLPNDERAKIAPEIASWRERVAHRDAALETAKRFLATALGELEKVAAATSPPQP